MPESRRIVVDTNIVVSGLLFPRSDINLALSKAQTYEMLASEATKQEVIEVLSKPKFDRYLSLEIRKQLAAEYIRACEAAQVHTVIQACRHPKDDKFLELAVDGRADLILTGDNDLLVLNPFRSIRIMPPKLFLELE
jgi:putative PIN family toxin of toxin-antitoxin system